MVWPKELNIGTNILMLNRSTGILPLSTKGYGMVLLSVVYVNLQGVPRSLVPFHFQGGTLVSVPGPLQGEDAQSLIPSPF